jgi:branched-chain amino acid aminotransferase
MLFVIASYFPDLPSSMPFGMKLLASQNDEVRAWPGGFGFAKVGANYGPSLAATGEAKTRGYDQILWLLGQDNTVTEAGASNFFIIWRSRKGKLQLVTAPLGDKVILDGVTRRSVIELVKERLADNNVLEAVEVIERKYTMDEVLEAVDENRMIEAFACGTAVSQLFSIQSVLSH